MASKNNESTMKWKVDIAALSKSMQDAKRQISLANAEFKNATAGMKNWQQSATGLESKLKQLKTTYDAQTKTLESLNKKYEITVKELGEASPEAQKLKIQIQNQEAAIKKTAAEIGDYNKQLDTVQKNAKQSESELGKLTDKVAKQEEALAELTEEYKTAVLQYGKNSDEAKSLAKEITTLSADLKENKERLKEADDAAESLTAGFNDTQSATDEADEGFTVMKGVLADLAATAIKAVVDGLKDLANAAKEAWQEFDSGRDTITKLTGATGENAEALMSSYKTVAKTVNADLNDIGSAIGEVNTRFGSTGEELENLSTLFLKFADINGTDVLSSVDDVQKAMSAYGIGVEDTEGFLDRLTATAQATGISTNKLTSGIVTNATAFQEMGLSVDEAVSLMGQLEKSGVSSEAVLSGMRKALKASAEDGVSMSYALSDLQKNVTSSANSADALNAAYELFGKNGDQVYRAIKSGTLNFNDLATAAEDVSGTVNRTFEATLDAPDELALEVQKLKVDLAEVADDMITEYGPQIKEAIQGITSALSELIPKIAEAIGWIVDNGDTIIAIISGIVAAIVAMKVTGIIMAVVGAFQALFAAVAAGIPIMTALNVVLNANPIGIIIGLIAGLVTAFVVLWNKSKAFRDFWKGMWAAIKETVKEYVDAVVGFFKAAWEVIKIAAESVAEFFAGVWENIKAGAQAVAEFLSGVWESIKEVWGAITTWVSDNIITPLMELIQPFIDWIKELFNELSDFVASIIAVFVELATGCWELIKAVWEQVSSWFSENVIEPVKEFFTGLWDTISGAAETAWNAIKDTFNAVKGWFDTNVVQPVKSVFTDAWDSLKSGATGAWEGIKEVFSSISDWFKDTFSKAWQAVKDVFSTGGKVFDGIKEGIVDAFKEVVNAIIRGINKVISVPFNAINNILKKIKDVKIAGIKPFKNLIDEIDAPEIPELARGGVLRAGQVGLLEGTGAEAVVPLEKNREWIAKVAEQLKSALGGSDLANTLSEIAKALKSSVGSAQLGSLGMIGGTTNTRTANMVFNQTINSPKALDRMTLYRETNSLLFTAKVREGNV